MSWLIVRSLYYCNVCVHVQGLLVTLCSSGVMYVWTFMGTHPRIVYRRNVVNEV